MREMSIPLGVQKTLRFNLERDDIDPAVRKTLNWWRGMFAGETYQGFLEKSGLDDDDVTEELYDLAEEILGGA